MDENTFVRNTEIERLKMNVVDAAVMMCRYWKDIPMFALVGFGNLREAVEAFTITQDATTKSTTPFPPVFGLESKYFQFLGRNVNVVYRIQNPSSGSDDITWWTYTASGMFGFAHDGKACCVESSEDNPIAFFQPQDIISIEFA